MNITTEGVFEGRVGSIEFETQPRQPACERTAEGFKILTPIKVALPAPQHPEKTPMICNLRGSVRTTQPAGGTIELGCVVCVTRYTAPTYEAPAYLEWRGSLPALALYEKLRARGPVKFEFRVAGDVWFITRASGLADRVCWAPVPFFEVEHLTYPSDSWARVLRQLGVSDIVAVEILLANDPPTGWGQVWAELSNAKSELERGGSTAWRNCALGVRRALEEWRKIEEEEEEKDSTRTPLRDRSKEQRFGDLRRHLKNYADRPVHTSADEWSREEAVLMLASLSALLAVRKP
jgi:hypothetical protein